MVLVVYATHNKEDEVIVLLYHGFLQDNDDGSQTEIRLDKNTNSGSIF